MIDNTKQQQVGELVRTYRICAGLTQQEVVNALAPRYELTQQALARIESGKIHLNMVLAGELAGVLGVQVSDLSVYHPEERHNGLFSDENMQRIITAYKTLPCEKKRTAVSEVVKTLANSMRAI